MKFGNSYKAPQLLGCYFLLSLVVFGGTGWFVGASESFFFDDVKTGHVEGVQSWLGNSVDVNVKDDNGDSALMWAAKEGHKEIVRMLIDAKADVNVQDKNGRTALMWASGLSEKADLDMTKLLIDAGAEYENYASDITRTFPINGRFTQEQASIYQIVLEAQRKVIAAAKPKVEWSKLQFISEITIIKGLIRLGILSGNPNNVLRQGQHKRFYMHGFGHWLGLDVHDVGSYKNNDGSSKLLEPGMVFTVEPGIYISEANKSVAAKWHNIGIRIEDNILITEKGCKVLTDSLPKDINDLRQIIGSAYA